MREILKDDKRYYALYETITGDLVLQVLCGGIAMYERELTLSPEQRAYYQEWGKFYLDGLALKLAGGLI